MGTPRRFFNWRSDRLILALILGGALIVAFLVQQKISFLNFFFLPVILAGYYLGKRQAVLSAFFCILLVTLYVIFESRLAHAPLPLDFDTILNLVTWGCFLILTGGLMGSLTDERGRKIRKMREAYVGILGVVLKYLEMADDERPRSVRLALLAGRIGRAAGLDRRDEENLKSAALLAEAGSLRQSLPLFSEVSRFMEDETTSETTLNDRERVTLRTTASLLKDVEPILNGYFHHYVDGAGLVDKDLSRIPLASSILALAELYDRMVSLGPQKWGTEEIRSWEDLQKMSGLAFPETAVHALREVDLKMR